MTLVVMIVATVLTLIIGSKVYMSGCVVQSDADAIAIATSAMIELYGEETVDRKGPYVAEYSRQDGTWHIYGTLPTGYVGGTPEVIVSARTGCVISIWGGK